MTRFPARRGMTLLEVASALAILALLSTVLAAAVAESRRHAPLTQNFANLQQFAAGTTSYAAEYQDRFWSFSWREGHEGGPFGVPSTDLQAIADQAIDIMRRRGERPDMTRLALWYPPIAFTHLVLLDHLQMKLPAPFVAGPEDRLMQLWQEDPLHFDELVPNVERPSGSGTSIKRWPYSSSYEVGPAFYAYAARQGFARTLDQHTLSTGQFNAPQIYHPGHHLSEVAFPSQKVMVYERYQRHFGPREAYFMYDEARIPILFADGAAAVRRTAEANRGFRPNSPANAGATLVRYEPQGWEDPTLSGTASEPVYGHYRWTRGGLKGRDFDAGEIDTSDW